MLIKLILVALCVASTSIYAQKINIPEISKGPKIDGKLDDECWKNASKIYDFKIFIRGPIGSVTNDTEVLLTRDRNWLYIGLRCHNPNMQHVESQGTGHDDSKNYKDDAVEIMLGRQGEKHFFSFLLTCDNMKGEVRIEKSNDFGWDIPWASATTRTDQGWTAEIAIPMFIVNSSKTLDLGLNFLRNKIEVPLDPYGAPLSSGKKVISCWKLIEETERASWPPFKLSPVKGGAYGEVEEVFLPAIVKIEFCGYGKIDGKLGQVCKLKLRNYSSQAGTAVLTVVENDKSAPLFKKTYSLAANSEGDFVLNIPSLANADKPVLVLSDGANRPFQTILLPKLSLVSDVLTERNYYTSEKSINVKVVFNLDNNFLKDCNLLIKNADGKTIKTISALKRETVFSIPSKDVPKGETVWSVSLREKNRRECEVKQFKTSKLPPNPGKEIKIDRFRRIILDNGKPFFMFCLWTSPGLYGRNRNPEFLSGLYKRMAEAGFNTVQNSYRRTKMHAYVDLDKVMKLATRYNFKVIDMFIDIKDNIGLDVNQNKKDYNKLKPAFMKDAEIVNGYDNLLGHYSVDEPNLGNWKNRLEVCEWYYKDIKKLDPYRLVFALYARNIPPGKAATEWFDVFGYDIYTYPNRRTRGYLTNAVNHMALEMTELNARIAKVHKPIYAMPLATSLDTNRCPFGLSCQEQIAQSYSAIIYGAKGINYFKDICTWGEGAWKAYQKLGSDLKVLDSALLAMPVRYEKIYKGKEVDIPGKKFPFIHAGLFKYPDGDYVLLAVNSKYCDVEARFSIQGIKEVSRMFGKRTKFKIKDNSFADKLGPLAVRAYKLVLNTPAPASPIKIIIDEKEYPETAPKRRFLEDDLKQASTRKNIVLNPSFEWGRKIKGVPDYYHPHVAIYPELIGFADHPYWALDTVDPYHGEYCVKLSTPETAPGLGYPNQLHGIFCNRPEGLVGETPQDYTISFYMKGRKKGDKASVSVRGGAKKKTFQLTDKWKRYSMPVRLRRPASRMSVSGRFIISPEPGSTVWVDAIQLEKGKEMTDFSSSD